MSIRDTSAQDRPVASSTTPAVRKRRSWLLVGGAGLTALLLVGWFIVGKWVEGVGPAFMAGPALGVVLCLFLPAPAPGPAPLLATAPVGSYPTFD